MVKTKKTGQGNLAHKKDGRVNPKIKHQKPSQQRVKRYSKIEKAHGKLDGAKIVKGVDGDGGL